MDAIMNNEAAWADKSGEPVVECHV